MSEQHYDVVIIGGGIIGSAVAYYLAKTESRLAAVVIEKDPTYSQASTPLCLGNVRIQFNLRQNIQISQYAQEVFQSFEDEMAVGSERPHINWRREGNLYLKTEAGRQKAMESLRLQHQMGCDVEWILPDQIQKLCPLVNLKDIVGGTFSPKDGTLNPFSLLMAYKAKAKSLGATYVTDEAMQILTNKGRVTGVKTVSGTVFSTNTVINCGGPWAKQIAIMAGVEIPVEPIKRQVFAFEPQIKPEIEMPVISFPSGLWIYSEPGGVFLIIKRMADDTVGSYDFNWDRNRFMEHLWVELAEYVPAWDTLKLIRGYAGLYEFNMLDENAIIGEWPDVKGFYLANGFSGHGFQQAPAVGRHISELVTGQTPSLDLSIFSPTRILSKQALEVV